MNELKKITNLQEYQEAIQGHTMLVFSTTWCPDCHFLKQFINDLVNDNQNWDFYYIDRDEMVDLCIDLDVMGIPSFIAYCNGKEIGRLVNKLRKTQEEIQMFIDGLEK